MRYILISILVLISAANSFTQYNLNENNINARVEYDGVLFNVNDNEAPGYEILADSLNSTFYAFSFWVGGKNDTSTYVYGVRYMQYPENHDRFGPIMDSIYYGTEDELWKRVWKIDKEQIDEHILNYNSMGYFMPEVIQNWPAHGDVSKGQALNLAPFYDSNINGIYEPELGDYPKILGDHAIFLICNGERSNELMKPMGIESHILVYTYDCENEAYQNSVFAYAKHFNRSGIDYDDCYLGFFADADIGAASDDMMKTDVGRSTVYGINGDELDQSHIHGPGYGTVIPAQSVTILRGAKQDVDNIDNSYGIGLGETVNGIGYGDGIVDNEYRSLDYSLIFFNNSTSIGDPITDYERYFTLTGRWRNGDEILYGVIGFENSNFPDLNIISRYNLSENDPNFYGTFGIDPEGFEWDYTWINDIRAVGSSGPFTFENGTSRDIYMAFTHGIGDSVVASVNQMKEFVDIIKSDFESGMSPCGDLTLEVNDLSKATTSLSVYPNPFNSSLIITNTVSDLEAQVHIYTMRGELLLIESFNSTIELNLSKYADQTFIVKVISSNGVSVQKVIKN